MGVRCGSSLLLALLSIQLCAPEPPDYDRFSETGQNARYVEWKGEVWGPKHALWQGSRSTSPMQVYVGRRTEYVVIKQIACYPKLCYASNA